MLTEYQRSKMALRFRRLDTNGDGYLEQDDLTTLTRQVCDQLIPEQDIEGRRAVSEGYEAMWQHLSAVADGNTDGRISLEEYQVAAEQNLVFNSENYQNSIVRIITAAFSGVDTDKDGHISEAELVRLTGALNLPPTDAAVLFAKLDVNNTGKVSLPPLLDAIADFWQGDSPEGIGNFVVGRVS